MKNKNKILQYFYSCVFISVVLVVLKILKVIDCSWELCLSPIWLNITFLGIMAILVTIDYLKGGK